MKNVSQTSSSNRKDILDVISKGEDRYEVHFGFSPCPVTMNGQYLRSILSDLSIGDLSALN